MLLGTLGASFQEIFFQEKEIVRVGYGNAKGHGVVRASHGNKTDF